MTILDELAAHAKERVKTAKERISAEEMKAKALALPKGDFAFEKALKKEDIAFIFIYINGIWYYKAPNMGEDGWLEL